MGQLQKKKKKRRKEKPQEIRTISSFWIKVYQQILFPNILLVRTWQPCLRKYWEVKILQLDDSKGSGGGEERAGRGRAYIYNELHSGHMAFLFILRIGLFMLKWNDIKVETIYQKGFHSFFLVKRKNG